MSTPQTLPEPQMGPAPELPSSVNPAVNAAKEAAELKFLADGHGDLGEDIVFSEAYKRGQSSEDAKASIEFGGYPTMITGVSGLGKDKSYAANSHLEVANDDGSVEGYRPNVHAGRLLIYGHNFGEKVVHVGGEGTVKQLTGSRAEKAADIIHRRAAREVGKRTVPLAEARIVQIQEGLDRVKAK